jgi:hypothetical protein
MNFILAVLSLRYSLTHAAGNREMFWVQYEASENTDLETVRKVMEAIADIISPFPVAVFDVSSLGRGVMVCDPANSNPGTNIDDEPNSPVLLPRSQGFSSCSDSSSDADNRSADSESNENQEVNQQVIIDSFGDIDNSCGNTRTCPGEGTGTSRQTSDFSFSNGTINANGNGENIGGSDSLFNYNNNQNGDNEDNHDDGGDDDGGGDDPPTPDPASQMKLISHQFSGTVTLCVNGTLKQDLNVLVGLRIIPRENEQLAECRVILDPLCIEASALSSDNDDEEMLNVLPWGHFYCLEQVTAIVGSRGGRCKRWSKHPAPEYFTHGLTNSTGHQFDIGLDATLLPKLTAKGSKRNGKTVENDPFTVRWKPKLCPGAGTDYHWQYQGVGSPSEKLDFEFSSINRPFHRRWHEATFQFNKNSPPKCIRILVVALFERSRKLSKQRIPDTPNWPRRNLMRDLHSKHIKTGLQIKLENFDNDYFRFPTAEKNGVHLRKTIGFGGNEIGAGDVTEISVGNVSSSLGCKTC